MAAKGKVNAMGRSAKLFSAHHPKDTAKCQVKFTLDVRFLRVGFVGQDQFAVAVSHQPV
jgi:hypothetical protein